MLSFGWFCVVWLILTVVVHWYLDSKFYEDIETFKISFIVVGLMLSVCFVMYDFGESNKTEKVITSTENVLSLKDDSNNETNGNIRGNFLFTYGQVNSKENTYYRVIVGNNIDGFQMMDLNITETRLFFVEDNEMPKLITDARHIEYEKDKNWLIGGIIKVEDKIYKEDEIVIYKLYIPKSAVKIEFNVDMK